MARYRKRNNIYQKLKYQPWWVGVMCAGVTWLFFWVLLKHIHVPGWQTNQFLGVLDAALHVPALRHMSWLFIAIFLAGAAGSAWKTHERRQLLDQQRDLNSIKEMSWQAFERLVGEAYRRVGYRIEETGQGGADGGVDLVLHKAGKKVIVQCKQWRSNSVGAPVVREMLGLMAHHGATGVKIVCAGRFTKEAVQFASGKPIDLVSGEDLIALIRSVQTLRRRDGYV